MKGICVGICAALALVLSGQALASNRSEQRDSLADKRAAQKREFVQQEAQETLAKGRGQRGGGCDQCPLAVMSNTASRTSHKVSLRERKSKT